MSYHKAFKIVEGLENKQFIPFDYVDPRDTSRKCVIGALFKAVGVAVTTPERDDIVTLVERDDAGLLRNALAHLDMSLAEAELLQDVNDTGEMTPEARYDRVLAWLREECS